MPRSCRRNYKALLRSTGRAVVAAGAVTQVTHSMAGRFVLSRAHPSGLRLHHRADCLPVDLAVRVLGQVFNLSEAHGLHIGRELGGAKIADDVNLDLLSGGEGEA